MYYLDQLNPRESPNTILTNSQTVGSCDDVLCLLGAYEKLFWWFLGLNQFVRNLSQIADKKFEI